MIQWVLPSIDPAYRQRCLASLTMDIQDRTLVVDNSKVNRGVPASWNLGIDAAEEAGADWLVMVSESVTFGAAGGKDVEAAVEGDANPWVNFVCKGWHLVAFSLPTLRRVGRFDENFFPAYMEDTDYLIRLHLAGYPSPRENDLPHRWVEGCDFTDDETEHSIREGLIAWVDHSPYWRKKWGCDPPHAAWPNPFRDTRRDWTWWPPA